MEPFILALLVLNFLLALAGFWLLRSRLVEVEEALSELDHLALIPERIQSLAKQVEELEPEEIRMELDRLSAGLDRVEALIAVPAVTRAETAAPTRPEVVRAAVTRHLKDEGYRSVSVLDVDEDLGGDPVTVRVEAVRQGLLAKGTVRVTGQRVTESQLDPSYSMFP